MKAKSLTSLIFKELLAKAITISSATKPTKPPFANSPTHPVIDPITSTNSNPAICTTIPKPIKDITSPVSPDIKSPKLLNALFITKYFFSYYKAKFKYHYNWFPNNS